VSATDARASIVVDPSLSSAELLDRALTGSLFFEELEAARSGANVAAGDFRILIKPDLQAFETGSPVATDPALVERLIDLLCQRGYTAVNVCASADSSSLWAENRDVAVLADLLGYQYVTPGGHEYDILDLSEDVEVLDASAVPLGHLLHGHLISRTWRDADWRICFARNKTDEREGYALCLFGLREVLPRVDKDYHYRHRLAPGAVITELLRLYPVDFALIDATESAHGAGGSRAPQATSTHCMIASPLVVLADFAGALKMGLDPYVSPLAAQALRLGLPHAYSIDGNLATYPDWRNVPPVLSASYRQRDESLTLDRLLTPWLQTLDPAVFPLKQVVDAQVNPRLSAFFGDPEGQPVAATLLALINYAVGVWGHWLEAYRVLYDKDAIRRVDVPLGFSPGDFEEADYTGIRTELEALAPLLSSTPEASLALRWREIDGATVFEFQRDLPIPFDVFVSRVDVSQTIQLMNDYIGGVVVPVERDAEGRVVRQAERNLYLPQPNYLVLYQGKPIDVSKIEVCDYTDRRHRMYWKTIQSENDSATADDGIVSFTRSARGTLVSVIGKQRFTLPPFWQTFDLSLWPEMKQALVTHAYKTFFDRTLANFEALVEGREIRIGRSWLESGDPFESEPMPSEQLEELGTRLANKLETWLGEAAPGAFTGEPGPAQAGRIDEDGFRHFEGGAPGARGDTVSQGSPGVALLQSLAEMVADFLTGLSDATARDLARSSREPATLRP